MAVEYGTMDALNVDEILSHLFGEVHFLCASDSYSP